MKRLAIALVLTLAGCAPETRAQDVATADSLLAAGGYDAALDLYQRLARQPGADPAVRRRYLEALIEVGRYDEAIRIGLEYQGGDDGWSPAVMVGRALMARGRLREAEAQFLRAVASRDSLPALAWFGELLWRRGERDSAARVFERVIRPLEEGASLRPSEALAAGRALTRLGERDPQFVPAALRAYEIAARGNPADLEPLILQGELLLSRYNSGEAQDVFSQVLNRNPRQPHALLGLARRHRFDGDTGAMGLVQGALGVNPNLVEARVFLAGIHLDGEDYEAGRKEAERALAVDSTSLEARSLLAATHYLAGNRPAFDSLRRVIAAVPVHSAYLDATLAELAARHRRYDDAVRFAARAVAADSGNWTGWGLLGTNQMRTGQLRQARQTLEAAFRGDPYNVWIKNTLDLLDKQATFTEAASRRVVVIAEPGETALLAPYLLQLGEAAYDSLAARYRYRPEPPIRLEVYRRHADFSVRTLGLPGFEAVGVSFGPVLAINSPAARERGFFNWGSTTWHEIAHTFTLGVTANRIPRWLSEGLSVLEERRARPGWGAQPTVDFLRAWRAGRLPPVSRISESFSRPVYPGQIIHAYYQASLVAEMIEQEYGWPRMLALLKAYRDEATTEQAIRTALGISLDQLDARFNAYMKERFSAAAGGLSNHAAQPAGDANAARARADRLPRDFLAQLQAGQALVETGRGREAVPYLERAKALFPEYAGPGSPYRLLAMIYLQSDPARSIRELERQAALAETDYESNLELARLLEQSGDSAAAAAALERAFWISPFDPALHQRLATLYQAVGNHAAAVRSRQAVLALDPVDRTEALYRLAEAQYLAGDMGSARRTVLSALDLAPGYEAAQTLLLRIRRESN